MTSEAPSIVLSDSEIRLITGAVAPTVQFNELKRLGFTRVRRGLDRSLILERAHYEAVCAGAVVLAPSKLLKAAEAMLRPPAAPAAVPAPAPPPPSPPVAAPTPSKRRDQRRITVEEWAAQNYTAPPSRWVLNKWRRNGEIYPPPERVGRQWIVLPEARRIGEGIPYDYVPLLDRIGR